MEDKATEMEALLAQPQNRAQRIKQPALKSTTFVIAEILEEVQTEGRAKAWYLVRWEGYQPDWEAWRIHMERRDRRKRRGNPCATCIGRRRISGGYLHRRRSRSEEVERKAQRGREDG